MNCPVDKVAMRRMEERKIVMDWCELCDGIWLDAGELTHLTQTATDLPGLPPDPAHPASFPQRSEGQPPCPRCQQPMEEHPCAEGSSLLVDQCQRCRGIWLDRGELQNIYEHVRRTRHLGSEPPPPGPIIHADPFSLFALGAIALTIIGLLIALLVIFLTARR